ncbi:MarR family winged helix-turn-helix transcriptional regulator [Veronia pacifica]|uniref:MarR family transcriptional regulator n=1 Tax=Veronia pacifica TaxID=1080227 RepID=A0A1C3EMI9_9GAMM|nr:MarR family transcriptional regulator [Veronia pacifica]ODA34457.1 MarR family transcriptional regulator [Veronia pacifica]
MTKIALEDQLCFPLYAASRLMTRKYQPMLDQLGITYPQYLVMMVLWGENQQTVSAIGEKLFLNSNTLTPLLKRLQQLDLVTRERNPQDERQVLISLTEKGKSLHDQAYCYLEPMITAGDNREAQNLRKMLNKLIHLLDDEQ